MKSLLSQSSLAIQAPTALLQVGMAQVIQELFPHAQSVATTALSLEQTLMQWVPRQISTLIVVLGGQPEDIDSDVQRLLLLSERDPALHIVVYTYCRDTALLASLYARPQISLLARQAGQVQILQDMAVALAGVKVCSPCIEAYWQNQPLYTEVLTQAELNVLKHLVKGLSVSDIAVMMHRSTKTISAHKCNSMRKLGARNDSELFRLLRSQLAAKPGGDRSSLIQEMQP